MFDEPGASRVLRDRRRCHRPLAKSISAFSTSARSQHRKKKIAPRGLLLDEARDDASGASSHHQLRAAPVGQRSFAPAKASSTRMPHRSRASKQFSVVGGEIGDHDSAVTIPAASADGDPRPVARERQRVWRPRRRDPTQHSAWSVCGSGDCYSLFRNRIETPPCLHPNVLRLTCCARTMAR